MKKDINFLLQNYNFKKFKKRKKFKEKNVNDNSKIDKVIEKPEEGSKYL